MKTFEDDKKLKSLVKKVKLDSPGPDFTVNVMNRIFREDSFFEKIKRERVLGKGFWIILALFVILVAAMVVVSSTGLATGNGVPDLLSGIETKGVSEKYQSFFNRLGTVPVSTAGILLASSLLLFIERFISSKRNTIKADIVSAPLS